jgi:hypothetical protein
VDLTVREISYLTHWLYMVEEWYTPADNWLGEVFHAIGDVVTHAGEVWTVSGVDADGAVCLVRFEGDILVSVVVAPYRVNEWHLSPRRRSITSRQGFTVRM